MTTPPTGKSGTVSERACKTISTAFKQTEIGVIPEDWVVGRCEDVCLKIQDGTHFSPPVGGGDRLYVTSRNIGVGTLDVSDADTISEVEHRKIYSRCDTRKGDLLFTKDGANTGNAAINSIDEEISLLSSVAFLRFAPGNDARFYLQYVLSHDGQQRIKQLMSGNAITRLTLAKIRDFKVPQPREEEQRAIAAALSDVDVLIGALDKLIAKKRAIKLATTQQLLTGRKRLPSSNAKKALKQSPIGHIPCDWSVDRLSNLVSGPIRNGVFNAPARKGRGCKLINVINLYSSPPINLQHLEFFDATNDEIRAFSAVHGDLLFTRSSLTAEGIAQCNVVENPNSEDVVFDCHLIRVRPNFSVVDPFFLFRYCGTHLARNYFVSNAKTTTMTTIDQTVLGDLPVLLPPVSEQHAIAEVLSDMEAEIAAFEERREKTNTVKQGMMQELLTGRTRLV